VNGRKVLAASYNAADGGWESNPDCYTMPVALKAFHGKAAWEKAGGTWMGHDIASPSKLRASSVFQRFEAEALLAVVEHEAIGADEITDLIMVNMKGPDYTAHAYGPDSPEIKETLSELDRQMARFVALLARKAGVGQSVAAGTTRRISFHSSTSVSTLRASVSFSITTMPPTTSCSSTPSGCSRSDSH
jgi:hypothetical protein